MYTRGSFDYVALPIMAGESNVLAHNNLGRIYYMSTPAVERSDSNNYNNFWGNANEQPSYLGS